MDLTLTIGNFKSIKSTSIRLKPGVNLLIGPNGSGKTCLVKALKFVSDVMFEGAAVAVARAGGALKAYRRGQPRIAFRIEHGIGSRLYRNKRVPYLVCWQIVISEGKRDVSGIVAEQITIRAQAEEAVTVFDLKLSYGKSPKPLSLYTAPSRDLGTDFFSGVTRLSTSRSKSDRLRDFRKSVLDSTKAHARQADEPFLPAFSRWDDELSELCFLFFSLNEYDIVPDIAKESSDPLPYADMLSTGENVSEVIYALENQKFERLVAPRHYELGGFTRYNRKAARWHFRARPSPHWIIDRLARRMDERELEDALENITSEVSTAVSGIEAVGTRIDKSTGRRYVAFKAGTDVFSPEEVSDGTIKWLCMLVSLFVPVSAFYLLEEPENYLHPWMQQRLIKLMRQAAASAKTIFVVTTHSSTVLNAALAEEVIIVTSGPNGTQVTHVGDPQEIRQMLGGANFGLGDLWVSGAIGGVPENT